MNTDFFGRMLLLAQEAGDAAGKAAPDAAPSPFGGAGGFLIPFAVIAIFFYLILIRPQKKEQKKRLDMLNNLKKNDRVVTIGGVYGVVMNVKREADEVVLKIDETNDTKIRVLYSAIARVLTEESAEESKTK